ncbi:MAG: DNA translocase FtsK 4TM domain-containing protein [Flavobacteriales bacterium]
MAKNTLKNYEAEEEAAPKAEEKKPRSKKPASASNGRWGKFMAFLGDPRVQKISGIFLMLFSVFAFLSCFSYLFSAGHDDILVDNQSDTEEIPAEPYKNWMGKLGAHLAWYLMRQNFGIGAIALTFILFLIGFRVGFRRDILPFWKSVRLSVFALLFLPFLIGFAIHSADPGGFVNIPLWGRNLVGLMGKVFVEWSRNTIGWTGTLFLNIFIIGTFLIFNFNDRVESIWAQMLEWWKNRASAIAPDEEEEEEEVLVEVKPARNAAPEVKPLNEPRPALNQVAEVPDDDFEIEGLEEREEVLPEVEDEEVEEEEEMADEAFEIMPIPPVITNNTPLPAGTTASAEGDADLAITIEQSEEELTQDEIERTLEKLGPFDPKKDLSRYMLPSIELLKPHGGQGPQINKEELEANKNKIVETLNQYKIEISKIKASIGPTVTLYEIVPAPGVRISKIKSLEDDIALSLAALGIRIIAPIPGKGTIGIEVPNSKPDIVSMRSLIASEKFQNADMELPIVLGKTISNENFVVDLAKMPHLLMAGATGQGKSVGLNAILVSLLYKKHPAEIKFVLVDPKKVELTLFNKIERHFLAKLPGEEEPIITDTGKVVKTLNSLCIEMDQRYELLKTAACRNIKEYNAKFVSRRLNPENGHRYLPYIVLVVDEFADLIMTAGREVETPIARLAQLARAIGIHLIIATQRPSVNIITGTIKANFPARIAFRVTSKIDSRTILDAGGADQLIGRGDMLFSNGNDLIRIQCGFVDTPEVEEITDAIGMQQGYPDAMLLPEVIDDNALEMDGFDPGDRDDLFDEAARIVVLSQQGSASLLQRKLKLGYNRAGRLVDQLEAAGIIGPFEGSKARKVLIADETQLSQFLSQSRGGSPF